MQDPAPDLEPAAPSDSSLGLSSPLLALDRYLFSGEPSLNYGELVERAQIDSELAARLWRAMGFTVPSPEDRTFLNDDLEALQQAQGALGRGASVEDVVYHTRVMAAALSGVAEVSADNIVGIIEELRSAGVAEEQIGALFEESQQRPDIDRLIGYMYRRQLRAALWRKLARPQAGAEVAVITVGFVDLVRFTAITENIAEEELGVLIDRFETAVHERVHDAGGRIVKMIGDEVMFVTDQADHAVEIAVSLVQTFEADDSVPQARAGLATGSVLAHGGDYFGPVVNLAARIVGVARPSSVVVSQPLYNTIGLLPGLSWHRLPPKRLKGIGRTRLWSVARSE
jgi:adenylate cyclase